MFTIKAYGYDGAVKIYEAIELRISPRKDLLEFIRPGSDLTECLIVDGNEANFSVVYIENETGKTIECLRTADPHRVS